MKAIRPNIRYTSGGPYVAHQMRLREELEEIRLQEFPDVNLTWTDDVLTAEEVGLVSFIFFLNHFLIKIYLSVLSF